MITKNKKTIILLIVTILINFYTPLPFNGFEFRKRRNFINRIYLSTFAAFIIVLTDVVLNIDEFDISIFIAWILFLASGIVISYYLIDNQIFVNEEEYLLTMKENHEIDLNMTNKIIQHKKLDDKGAEYTNIILKNRQDELQNINKILDK